LRLNVVERRSHILDGLPVARQRHPPNIENEIGRLGAREIK
jgi:hypothetical protein